MFAFFMAIGWLGNRQAVVMAARRDMPDEL